MIKLGSDKKPHRQTSGKAPIEEGDAEEDLMYLWSKIGMIITCRYHIRKSALSSPLDLTLQRNAKGKFPDGCYPARALRALGLLLADGAPTVGRGKTF